MLPLLTSTLPAVAVLDENNKRDVWTEKAFPDCGKGQNLFNSEGKNKDLRSCMIGWGTFKKNKMCIVLN